MLLAETISELHIASQDLTLSPGAGLRRADRSLRARRPARWHVKAHRQTRSAAACRRRGPPGDL